MCFFVSPVFTVGWGQDRHFLENTEMQISKSESQKTGK